MRTFIKQYWQGPKESYFWRCANLLYKRAWDWQLTLDSLNEEIAYAKSRHPSLVKNRNSPLQRLKRQLVPNSVLKGIMERLSSGAYYFAGWIPAKVAILDVAPRVVQCQRKRVFLVFGALLGTKLDVSCIRCLGERREGTQGKGYALAAGVKRVHRRRRRRTDLASHARLQLPSTRHHVNSNVNTIYPA